MKIKDVIAQVRAIGIPYAYDHFNEEQTPPYTACRYVESNNFDADNKAYFKKGQFNVELYTKVKDPALEQQFEQIFEDGEQPYKKYESFIDNIKLYMVL